MQCGLKTGVSINKKRKPRNGRGKLEAKQTAHLARPLPLIWKARPQILSCTTDKSIRPIFGELSNDCYIFLEYFARFFPQRRFHLPLQCKGWAAQKTRWCGVKVGKRRMAGPTPNAGLATLPKRNRFGARALAHAPEPVREIALAGEDRVALRRQTSVRRRAWRRRDRPELRAQQGFSSGIMRPDAS